MFFRNRHIVFKKVLLNQEYNIILLMGILNMQIQQGFVPPGDETAINWTPEHCAARSRWRSCTVVRCTSWRNHCNCSGLFFENCRIRILHLFWSRFSLISVPQKKVSGSCTHNFDATDLPNLNGYTPNISGGGLKVDLVSPVWPPALSKVSLSEKLSMILGFFWCYFWTY